MPRQQTYFIAFFIIVAGFGLYLFNPFSFYFLNDDFIHIPLSKQGILFQRNSFRPVGDLSIRLDYLLWGKNALGYHVTNLLLHVGNTVLVFLMARKLFNRLALSTATKHGSWMAALLFFVYAFHSESIFWIIGRSGSLGALFFLVSLLCYLNRNKGIFSFILSLLFFEIGLLAYESVWIFPLAAILFSCLDRKMDEAPIRKEVFYNIAILFVFLLHLFIRWKVIGQVVGGYEGTHFTNFNLKLLAANFLKLLTRTFIPPMDNPVFFVGSCLLLVFSIAVVILKIKKKHATQQSKYPLLFLAVLFVFSLLPYLSLGISTHSIEGERYLYLPSVFAVMLVVIVIGTLFSSVRSQFAFFTMFILMHLLFLSQSAQAYKTASAVTKTTIAQINTLKNKRRLFIDSLPQSKQGALMFRLGFEEGVEWLKEDGAVDSVFVLSVKPGEHINIPYQVIDLTNSQPLFNGQLLVKDTTQAQTYCSIQRTFTYNATTDAWFVFNNEKLQIVK